jgi:hypothetical protein
MDSTYFSQKTLIFGDVLALLIVTVIGFMTHDTLFTAGIRFVATLVPTLVAWFVYAALFGALRVKNTLEPRDLWRVAVAMVLAAPLMGWLRAEWLARDAISWVFVAVFAAVGTLGMLIWRGVWLYLARRAHVGGATTG